MTASSSDVGEGVLFDLIGRARAQRRTGVYEFEVRAQRRALHFVDGELHLTSTHPHAARWRDLLGKPKEPGTAKAVTLLLDQFWDSLRDWGVIRRGDFHEGQGRLPGDLVGPLPTAKLLRVAAGRHPRAPEDVAARFGSERLVAGSASGEASYVWTPEELWILERLRQPTTLADLVRASPIPREALYRAVAGLAATGQLRAESGAASSSRSDELRELADKLAERIGADLARGRANEAERGDFRQRIGALLSNAGGLDHFELLGIDPDASDDEALTGFEELARLVHPANARRYDASELADALRFLFERATDAYQTLTDPQRRAAYRNALQLPEQARAEIDPGERAREVREMARRQFERAVAEERNGEYHTAMTLFEEVIRLEPTVEHWSALAKLQEKNPAWTTRAIESWRTALTLDPQNGAIRYALGGLYERAGDIEQALLCYQSAASGATPMAAAVAAVERLRSGRGHAGKRGSAPRRLSNLFRRL